MRFLVDAQLPRALARWLIDAGHDVLHTSDMPRGNRTRDSEIVAIADRDGRVVVTKDSDFVLSHHLHGQPAKLLLISTGNLPNSELLTLFERELGALASALSNFQFVELGVSRLTIHH